MRPGNANFFYYYLCIKLNKMVSKTHLHFNFTLTIDGIEKNYRFDRYANGEFPEKILRCVYVFSDFKSNNSAFHYHIDHTDDFSSTFPIKYAKDYLKKFKADSVLIYESDDLEEIINIVNYIRTQYKSFAHWI